MSVPAFNVRVSASEPSPDGRLVINSAVVVAIAGVGAPVTLTVVAPPVSQTDEMSNGTLATFIDDLDRLDRKFSGQARLQPFAEITVKGLRVYISPSELKRVLAAAKRCQRVVIDDGCALEMPRQTLGMGSMP